MKAFITKYALTKGIQEVDDAELSSCMGTSGMISVKSLGLSYFHGEGKDWHKTIISAQNRANSMRVKKIYALKRSIAKLEALDFSK